ncbi:hypothetical protein BC940DRAFT_331975 [Gongronella butleri]|nr:hypothetical protein BC940DRAFT_331975 [Gongronella butleri]
MHPAAIVFIVLGGVACGWGSYELGKRFYEWMIIRRERMAYEDYVRTYQDKDSLYDTDDDLEDDWAYVDRKTKMLDDDDVPLMHSTASLRQRRPSSRYTDEQELEAMESSIEWRRRTLERQASLLMEDERAFHRRRSELVQERGNRVMGLDSGSDMDDVDDHGALSQSGSIGSGPLGSDAPPSSPDTAKPTSRQPQLTESTLSRPPLDPTPSFSSQDSWVRASSASHTPSPELLPNQHHLPAPAPMRPVPSEDDSSYGMISLSSSSDRSRARLWQEDKAGDAVLDDELVQSEDLDISRIVDVLWVPWGRLLEHDIDMVLERAVLVELLNVIALLVLGIKEKDGSGQLISFVVILDVGCVGHSLIRDIHFLYFFLFNGVSGFLASWAHDDDIFDTTGGKTVNCMRGPHSTNSPSCSQQPSPSILNIFPAIQATREHGGVFFPLPCLVATAQKATVRTQVARMWCRQTRQCRQWTNQRHPWHLWRRSSASSHDYDDEWLNDDETAVFSPDDEDTHWSEVIGSTLRGFFEDR